MERCLALVGMVATHILPSIVDGEVPLAHQAAAGRSSALFALLAGTSLVLASGTRAPLRGRELGADLAATAVRSLLIGVVGLLLGGLQTGIAVILAYYAVLFVVAAPFLALSSAALAVVAAVWAVGGPVVSHVVRSGLPPPSYAVPSFDSLEQPATLLRELVVTGYYPVLTWVPYLLLGILVGRLDLRSWRAVLKLGLLGGWAVVLSWTVSDTLLARQGVPAELIRTFEGAGWRGELSATLAHGLYGVTPTRSPWWLAVRAPHSGTTFDLLMTGGSACVVIAICLAVGHVVPRAASVVFGAGAMTLTLYSLHVVLRQRGWWDADDTATFVGQVVLVLLIGAAFGAARRRGPLERLVGEVSREVGRAVRGRAPGTG